MTGLDGVVSVDQTPIKGSRRSIPATYTGLLDPLRKAFVKESGVNLRCSAPIQRVAHGDWIIDLGPGAGHDGGRIVFEGTPADLIADKSTLTGEHLAAYVGV